MFSSKNSLNRTPFLHYEGYFFFTHSIVLIKEMVIVNPVIPGSKWLKVNLI